MNRQVIKYVLPLFVLLFLVVNPVLAQDSLFDETKTISDNQIWYIHASLKGGESYEFSLTVESGDAIDLIAMDTTNFNIYKTAFEASSTAEFSYLSTYSAKSIKSKSYTITFDETKTVYFVVENADFLEGGASGGGSVDIKISLAVSESAPGFEWGISLLGVSIFFFLSKKKR
jgi:hypothetical protein